MQVIRELEQGTEAWHLARMGIVTMSELQCLLVNGKGTGGFGAGAITYMNQLIGERITDEPADAFQGNRHTERGHSLEPMARELYTERYGLELEQVGIILNHGAGYSPDSLVGSDGLVEIKTKLPKFQVEVLLGGEIPREHAAQCQGGLWISEREWIDFISYCPGMPLFVKRAYRDEVMIRKISERVRAFHGELEDRMNLVMAA
jgi:hypothetical protein